MTHLSKRQAPETLVLTFAGAERIETTQEHPFYVQHKGFTPAGLLAVGNAIVTRAGPALQVLAKHEKKQASTVYNFSVQDNHTYFVGRSGLWVHNESCYSRLAVNLPQQQEDAIEEVLRLIKENGPTPQWVDHRTGHWGVFGKDAYRNDRQTLPIPGRNPRIYDLNPTAFPHPDHPRGTGRIVVNDDGQIFFSGDHYGSFHEIDNAMFGVS